jgi:mannose-6-phosphate isomerase-like protein (cupin superfamily)
MAKWKRYVITSDDQGKSYTKSTEATMEKEEPGVFYRIDIWATAETPVDNNIEEDRALSSLTREPVANGATFRTLEIFPDKTGSARDDQREKIEQLHREVKQKHMPTAQDYHRHPSMHRTDTLDVIYCVRGEIYLMTDLDEVLMTPGDAVVIRGVNHAWSNRSNEPALLVGAMIDAIPR